MDALNLHFSEFDFDEEVPTKQVIRNFLITETTLAGQMLDDLVDLIFLAWQQGYSTGYAQGTDAALGLDAEDYDD